MKKVFCIALVGLHLLNIVGGYWLFYTLRIQTNQELAHRLDLDRYAGSQAITIKLPISHSNGSDNDNYERVDGRFEFEGTTYRLVKQKFYKDTVYIVCYKDTKTIAIDNALEDYVKSFTDNPNGKKSESKAAVNFVKDYLVNGNALLLTSRDANDMVCDVRYVNHYRHFLHFSVDHPPEFIG